METSKKVDEKIAEHLFGWKRVTPKKWLVPPDFNKKKFPISRSGLPQPPPRFSTNPLCSRRVITRLETLKYPAGCSLLLSNSFRRLTLTKSQKGWKATVEGGSFSWSARADTQEMAVCLAALEVVRIEV